MDYGQTQTRSLVNVLCRKERDEYLPLDILTHANARILYNECHMVLTAKCPDRQLPSLWHRLHGIDNQVDQDLVYLCRIGGNLWKIR